MQYALARLFDLAETLLNKAFGRRLNPLNHLGSLTIYFFWLVLVSGVYIFFFFKTSITGAYQSMEYLTHEQWYLGGIMRSVHRYASDAAIITIALHLLKEYARDRFRGTRWYSWVTGIPLVWLVFPLGISGYWLVWDRLAQYIAVISSELIDVIPIFTDSMARNFLTIDGLSDRFFTLLAFVHLIGLPMFLIFAIWMHVMRINNPKINPPRALMIGTGAGLLLLSLIKPALSQGPAQLDRVTASIGLDWFYLHIYPLIDLWSEIWVWALLLGISLALAAVPFVLRAKVRRPALVDLDNCNGCSRCASDCPFNAITMVPRTDALPYAREALVDAAQCVSCGICVGACPTATPFRRRGHFSPGIDLPDNPAMALRQHLIEQADGLPEAPLMVVFQCDNAPALELPAGCISAGVRCMGHLPPSFIDYALNRIHAHGVFLLGCTGGDCKHRLGVTWSDARISRERDPMLRQRVSRQRLAVSWEDGGSAQDHLHRFRDALAQLDDSEQPTPVADRRPAAVS
jgi:quinol-cytochrome oxidoreductase complex cytochrome b subunit/coenzyme F420-reducing hydrogenase delta subunit